MSDRFNWKSVPAAATDSPAGAELVELLATIRKAARLSRRFVADHLNGCRCGFCQWAATLGDDDSFDPADVRESLTAFAHVAEFSVIASVETCIPGPLSARVDQRDAAEQSAEDAGPRPCTCHARPGVKS